MNTEQILRQLSQSIPPEKLQQMVRAAQQQLQGINPQDLDIVIRTLAAMLENPNQYEQMRADLIQQGVIDEKDLPPQFVAEPIGLMLIILLVMRRQMSQAQPEQMQGMARGGLAQMARQGRGGDTMLAHINPREAMMLQAGRRRPPTTNPVTGLPEYGGFGDIFAVLAPIALDFFVPGAGTALGAALGASAAWAPVLGGAIIGGASSALGGGDPLKGALFGGLGGGMGEMLGSNIGEMTGWDMSPAMQKGLGNALTGGVASALGGGDFLKGAVQGGIGSVMGDAISGLSGGADTALGRGLQSGGKDFGNLMAAGYSPRQALTASMLGALTRAAIPSSPPELRATTGDTGIPTDSLVPVTTGDTGMPTTGTKLGMNMQTAAVALPLLSMMSTPEDVKVALQQMSPEQQEYFNRPSITWNWDSMRNDANMAGQSLGQFMAQNWNRVVAGQYNNPIAAPQPKPMANGGLSQVAYMVRGGGSGRDDTVDARLSDGEYVMDAETVAMLGDGSTKAGARMLDDMRVNLRRHKGKALVQGKFSPNAKSPLSYLKGAA